ncbi:adenosine deaminase [Actinomyces urogenitalis]|nr:adenosine deaminase [Actinomyces urogenitalis]MDU0863869.1 adenosine deaminase [Actinomyces urogenitalis]MDU0874547.1 adenosine deaminase [Actinomyces urogenitalis]MDU1564055.1 adenosine deaminase [Actinomyces urogenitalis]MDU1639534.1 adenosine deaminase [Actinomyces urogenitalis]MDU6777415.1 adenosine deaminase [Actinomyces urogenitalis]
MRDLSTLPKAHLHLHFTGSMRLETLVDLAQSSRTRLPSSFIDGDPLRVPADHRGWFRFQRAYDTARHLVTSEETMRRIVVEAALDDAAEGSRRLEIQVDPTSYAPFVGGITPALEIILDAARQATILSGVEVAVIVAASRIRHPLDARTLARLAVRYAGQEPGTVVGFGLSNDERAGRTASWGPAFRIAQRAGLASLPHGGELLGPSHVRDVVSALGPTRLGHGVRTAEDPALLDEIVRRGISLEVCPASNVSLGVYHEAADVPLPTLLAHGAQVALGADDPLLFHSRLTDQYEIARSLGLGDAALAELARGSIRASLASPGSKARWLAEVDDWLASNQG